MEGIFPRDTEIRNTLALYFGGFWKRFTKDGGSAALNGVTQPFEIQVFARNRAVEKEINGFGKVVILEYLDPPYNLFCDVLKIVNEDTIIGKAYVGDPNLGREIMTFSMSRKYPFEFMTEADHEMLYKKMKKPNVDAIIGIWEGQLVSDSPWSDPIFQFRYYFGDLNRKTLKNDYVFGNTLAGTADVIDKGDRLEMQDATGGAISR